MKITNSQPIINMFKLDLQLQKDTFFIKDLKLCQVLLMNNCLYPWVILVPKKENLVEIIDLTKEEQILLIEEIALISEILKKHFNPKKLNVANLGNMVCQLHIHIIARFENDPAFPKPVWGQESKQYEDEEAKKMVKVLSDKL
jgi:diadenosine tetraphosphate (Ap4A) HIT family hydrolase